MLRNSSSTYERAKMLWSRMPDHLRLAKTLQNHKDRTALQQDFLLNARLTYLQIILLLSNGEGFLKHASLGGEARSELLDVSKEMLSLVVEAIVLRNYLVNSGTGLIWKVNHHLPLASLLVLAKASADWVIGCALRPSSCWHRLLVASTNMQHTTSSRALSQSYSKSIYLCHRS